MSLLERRVTLDGKNAKRREFVYLVPVKEPVVVQVPFYADTPENKAARYAMVCAGFQDNPLPTPPLREEKIDFMVRERRWDEQDGALTCHGVQVWLMPNKYTHAKHPTQVGWLELKHLSGLSESAYLNAEIERLIRQQYR